MSRRKLPFSNHPGFSCTQWVVPSHPVVEGALSTILQTSKVRRGFLKELPKDKAGKWQSWNLAFVVTTLSKTASYLFQQDRKMFLFDTFSSDNRSSYKWSLVKI